MLNYIENLFILYTVVKQNGFKWIFFSLKYIYILERKENKTIKFDHYYGDATMGKDLQESSDL